MFFKTDFSISRPIVGGVVIFMLVALAGMKHERSLASASQWTRVDIEVLPGDASKFIDASTRSRVPVAILSSMDFDASTVNPASVTLAGAPITKNRKGQLRWFLTDINGDGRPDLVVYVSVYSLHLDPGTSEALLTAMTFDGISVSGSQQVSFSGRVAQDSPLSAASLGAAFSNSSNITIGDSFTPPTTAKPYPSNIIVSGQPTVTKITASLLGYSHTFPDDVDILVVGPTGATCLLMADCGGSDFVNNINLTFDDAFPSLPDDSQITTGTYKPTKGTCPSGGSNCVPDDFPSPAPAHPYGTTLSVFNGTNPNGTWQLYVIDDSAGDDGVISGGWSLTINASTSKAKFDFDGDRKADIAIWRPSDGNWWILNSSGGFRIQQWGFPNDKLVPGDYDGDGKTDVAIWRPSDGNWWILNSSDGTFRVQQWGFPDDIPVPGDYDGDGKTDIAIYRPSDGNWWILNSSDGSVRIQQWGLTGDKPVPGDYDGDGKTDVAIWRPADGNWWILNSSGGFRIQQWGFSSDKLVPGDYDGDGKTDVAIWRPADGNWWILNSSNGSVTIQQWGFPGDKLVPADYDGDGKTDIAIWRPSDGNWWILNSSDGTFRVQQWGFPLDTPVPSVYVR